MPEQQLTVQELALIKALRVQDELTFEQIGERIGVDTSTAHRVYTVPGYQLSEMTLIRIRKGLARLAEEREPATTAASPRRKRA